jgi:hypothetical protein
MDRRESLQERSEVFEHETETLPRQACVVARQHCRWRGIAGHMLILGLLSLALPVRTVEAQRTRLIPISLCTTSVDIILMSGGQSPRAGEIICPITEDVPFLPSKSQVDILSVQAFSFNADTTITVLVCSQDNDNPQVTFCSSKGRTGQGFLPIQFTGPELRANAWGPEHANDFGYVRIRFSGSDPQAAVTGIFLFFD